MPSYRVALATSLTGSFLVDEAHHRVAPTGGPQKYTGKSMAESHKDLKITSKEWESFLDDFQQTLDKFAVPTKEQAELKTIVNSTRSDIVVDSGFLPGVKS